MIREISGEHSETSLVFNQVLQASDNSGLSGLESRHRFGFLWPRARQNVWALEGNSGRYSKIEDLSHLDWIKDNTAGINSDGIKAKRLRQWYDKWDVFC